MPCQPIGRGLQLPDSGIAAGGQSLHQGALVALPERCAGDADGTGDANGIGYASANALPLPAAT